MPVLGDGATAPEGRVIGPRSSKPPSGVVQPGVPPEADSRAAKLAAIFGPGLDAPKKSGDGGRSRSLQNERVSCGSIACSGGWTPPWRSQQYPFFEEKWACSTRCLQALVKQAIARETGDGQRDILPEQHRHRIPLGLVLLAQGWITHPQLRQALEVQRMKGSGRIGDWLVSECGVGPEWVTRGLSVQWNCPVLTTEGFSPEAMAKILPRVFVEEYGILPLRIAGLKILYVGFQDHLDASCAFAVEQMTGLRTESGVIGEHRYKKARDLLLGCRFAQVSRTTVPDRDALAKAIVRVVDQRRPTESRLVRLHQYYWLRLWNEGDTGAQGGRLMRRAEAASDCIFTVGA